MGEIRYDSLHVIVRLFYRGCSAAFSAEDPSGILPSVGSLREIPRGRLSNEDPGEVRCARLLRRISMG